MGGNRSNETDQPCCLALFILLKKKKMLGATRAKCTSPQVRRTICVLDLPTDNNITRTIKGRNCILRKTRAIKVCSARTSVDIPGRRRVLLRYSRTKSLPNPSRVRVPASIRIYICIYRYIRMKRK